MSAAFTNAFHVSFNRLTVVSNPILDAVNTSFETKFGVFFRFLPTPTPIEPRPLLRSLLGFMLVSNIALPPAKGIRKRTSEWVSE